MSPPEFLFTMHLGGSDDLRRLLPDVSATVFRHVGCAPAVVADLIAALETAASRDRGPGFDVQFVVRDGRFEAIVSARDREIWRTSRQVPA